jgi:hypothetical protein
MECPLQNRNTSTYHQGWPGSTARPGCVIPYPSDRESSQKTS